MKRLILLFAVLGVFSVLIYNCGFENNVDSEKLTVQIRWLKSYPEENRENVVSGLKWILSYLGASLPKGSLEDVIVWNGESSLTLNISNAGFNEKAENAFVKIIDAIKESEEYKVFESIDLGRFVMLVFNSSHHYFSITGAEESLSDFRSKYSFEAKKAGVVSSSISLGSRVIEISEVNDYDDIAFIAMEGEGSIKEGNFKTVEYEALDFMPNGQIRVALYDSSGQLKSSASPSLTKAGKPSKCLWCHELGFVPPFEEDHTLGGYYSSVEFKEKLMSLTDIIMAYRKEIISEIDFSMKQEHTQGELLYLSFMEPSIDRLTKEWGVSASVVIEKLRDIAPHAQTEFPFLGDRLYYRKQVEPLAPFKGIKIPNDAREYSEFEPDFIHL